MTLIWEEDDGNPVDLTGWSARSQARPSHDSPDTDLLFDLDNAVKGGVALGGTAGTIEMTIPSSETSQLEPSKFAGVWDLELVDGTGQVTSLLEGALRVKPEVTR